MEAARYVVKVIEKGKVGEPYRNGHRLDITLGDATAVFDLGRNGTKEIWLLTGWKEKAPDATGESNNHQLYTRQSSDIRTDAGAGTNTVDIMQQNAPKVNAEVQEQPSAIPDKAIKAAYGNDTISPEADIRYSVKPNASGRRLQEFISNLNQDARKTYSMFERIIGISQNTPGEPFVKFMRTAEWNGLVRKDKNIRRAVLETMQSIPDDIKNSMGLRDNGTIEPSALEKEFHLERSFMQRLVDALPMEQIPATYLAFNGKPINIGKSSDTVVVNGGESYRQALLALNRVLFKEGKLKPVDVTSLKKDTWGTLGFLTNNDKTLSSGDFTTLCPQMMFNKGCFYCYRKAALESGLNNKLAAQVVWYTGEILRLSDADIAYLNRVGGLRIQSFGDWMPHFSAQLVDVLTDAEARGLQVKIITKEPSMVDYVASLKKQGVGKNVFFNISADYVMEPVGEDTTETSGANYERPMENKGGKWYWKRALSVGEANAIQKKYPWVNVRIVATRLEEFIRGLKDPRVNVVTGYHGTKREFSRIDSETGNVQLEVEPLGDNGLPRFGADGQIVYPGKTGIHKRLANEIVKENLQDAYWKKVCCEYGKCSKCQGKCGLESRPESVKRKFQMALRGAEMFEEKGIAESTAEGRAAVERKESEGRFATVNPEKERVARDAMEKANDYLDNLEDAFNGNLDRRRMLKIGDTPKVLQQFGAGNLNLYINAGKIVKIRNDHPEITLDMLRQIPEEVNIPVAVVSSLERASAKGLIVLTTLIDTNKNLVILPVHIDVEYPGGMVINEVASVYGKRNDKKQLQELINNNLLYVDNEKVPQVFPLVGLQLPVRETSEEPERSIPDDTEIFKSHVGHMAVTRAAKATLAGEDKTGRPDLANPGLTEEARRGVRVSDQYAYNYPEAKRDEETLKEAAALDGGQVAEKILAGRGLSDAETLRGQELVTEAFNTALNTGKIDDMRTAVRLAHGWRIGGRELARALRMRRDRLQTPAERFEAALGAAFLLPTKNIGRRIEAITDRLSKSDITETRRKKLQQELDRLIQKLAVQNAKLCLELARRGIIISQLKQQLKDAKTEKEKQQAEDDANSVIGDILAARGGLGDAFYEFWISSLLSGPQTQVVNAASNILHGIWELGPQRLMEAVINTAAGQEDAAQWGEFRYMGAAFIPGMQRAFRNMERSWRTERPTFMEELGGAKAGSTIGLATEHKGGALDRYVGKRVGKKLRIPLRGLLALDEFTKSLVGQMEAAAYAYRAGKAHGMQGKELEDYIDTQVADLASPAWEAGLNTALRVSFQTPMSKGAEAASQWLGKTPFKWIIPFRRTPVNIFKTGIRKTPLGSASLAKNWSTLDGDDRVRLISEQMIGWAVAGALAAIVIGGGDDDEPWITGSIPYNSTKPGERLLKQRTVPAQSIRLAGKYYSYARIEPFATMLQGLVDATNAVREYKEGRPAKDAGLDLFSKALEAATDKTFLRGLGDLYDAMQMPEAKLTSYAVNFATSWSPNIIKQLARSGDDVVREQSLGKGGDYFDRLQDRVIYRIVPKGILPPKRTPWGEESQKAEGLSPATDFLFRLLSPIANTTPAGRDPRAVKLDRLLTNWNNTHWDDVYAPELPDRYIGTGDNRIDLTDKEYDQYIKETGELALPTLEGYSLNYDNPTKRDILIIKKVLEDSREKARNKIRGQRLYPDETQ